MKVSNSSLERAANLAIIVAAVVCAGAWTWHFVFRAPPRSRAVPQHVVGDSLADVPELVAVPGKNVLVVYVNSACKYCTESMPFYSRLVEHRGSEPGDDGATIVFVSREPAESLTAYMNSHGLKEETQIILPETTHFKTTVTPSLLLLDDKRVVRRVWTGLLAESDQDVVLREATPSPRRE